MSTLVWFRRDLRIADNPALIAAIEARAPVIPVFIHAPTEEGAWPPGGAARWWLHYSLKILHENLAACGSRLCIRASGDSLSALRALARESGATRVVWNRHYEPAAILRDREIQAALRSDGLETKSFNSALLHEPWTIRTTSGGPFRVFTPYWRHCSLLADPADPLPAPRALRAPDAWPEALALDRLDLLPRLPWSHGIQAAWTPGSAAARALLEEFLTETFDDYASRRDRPGLRGTSRLSPYLHFGEIGAREIWHATRRFALQRGQHTSWRESHFLRELGWREFAHHLLFHFPETPEQPLRARYAGFPWKSNATALKAWQRGTTGYPIVDAGMRELWQTGWMHNRVRMVVASFLVKDLLLPWTQGARWFWDTLVDADLASNTLGWQWVAGCGADAAPFFRIFNPVSQGTKFDADGTYVRRWVPEVSRLTDKWLHRPWEAPASELRSAGVILGNTYPHRIVDHEAARRQALRAYERLKAAGPTLPAKRGGS